MSSCRLSLNQKSDIYQQHNHFEMPCHRQNQTWPYQPYRQIFPMSESEGKYIVYLTAYFIAEFCWDRKIWGKKSIFASLAPLWTQVVSLPRKLFFVPGNQNFYLTPILNINLSLTFGDCVCGLICASKPPLVVGAWLSGVTHPSMDLRSYYKSPETMKLKWYLWCFRTSLIVPLHLVLFSVLAPMATTANSFLSVLLKSTKNSSKSCKRKWNAPSSLGLPWKTGGRGVAGANAISVITTIFT